MHKLFLKVYMPLAICIVMTLILSVVAMMKIIPAQLNAHRANVEEFRDLLLASHPLEKDSIIAVAESMDLEIIVYPNAGHLRRIPPQEGFYTLPALPWDYPWRIDLSGGPRGGPAGFVRKSFWQIVLILLFTEGLVLFVSLQPVRKRLSKLQWAASEIGSGSFGIKLQVKKKGDLIDNLGRTFNSMAKQIKSLIESHQELLGIVAHELRTPMARMRLALELIREDSGEENFSKIDRMEKDLISLDNLVTELLDFNKLRRESHINLEHIDLEGVCREMVQAESWSRDGIDITLRGKGSCKGDISLFGRAVGNLIRNAVNHAESKVVVSIADDLSSGSVRVSVADNGRGYDAGIIDRLGEPFTKGHSSKGTGLGLAIAKRIIVLHRGKLLFGSSDELGGAEAVIEIESDLPVPIEEHHT
ncbi:MAG: HAMP domain-containing histidine kinase [Candidatus Aegiribacteria sp.]|nr:HAMP domain-containing histidine kinase [Candidatus Aegiribacteria sp.]